LRYSFTWDPGKARENLQNHQMSFERATTVFRDPRALSIYDVNHSQEEDRWITLGLDRVGSLLVVVHTFHQVDTSLCNIRIISARHATRSEARQYREENP
jgi:uncharacterized DUF497 family protein